MGHNSVVSGYPKSKGIPLVDELSTGPPGFEVSQPLSMGINLTNTTLVNGYKLDKYDLDQWV